MKFPIHFEFVDITHVDFDAATFKVDPFAVHKVMHVKSPEGQINTGVEAFRTIWKELPKYQFLYRWTNNAFARFVLDVGYSGFVRIRPYLPRRKVGCAKSPYCDLNFKG